jgi:hypothetical protein
VDDILASKSGMISKLMHTEICLYALRRYISVLTIIGNIVSNQLVRKGGNAGAWRFRKDSKNATFQFGNSFFAVEWFLR